MIGRHLKLPKLHGKRDYSEKTTDHSMPILSISNIKERYNLKFGSEFKDMLDARDQVMEHQFQFTFDLNDPNILEEGGDLLKS